MTETPPISRTVFSIYFPETQRIVDRMWTEHPHHLYTRNYEKRQDEMHKGCLNGWVRWATQAGVRLGPAETFTKHYPTAGASEGIHALLSMQAAHNGGQVHIFDGEYEGYTHIARALALPVRTHQRSRETWAQIVSSVRPGDTFWVSQPSAIDGNMWADFEDFAAFLGDHAPKTKLIVDLTYVGAVPRPTPINLDMPNITAVLWSLSKPFGVYYHRIGGLLVRDEVPTLHGSLWFKNLFSLALGERLLNTYPAGMLAERYQHHQTAALGRAIDAGLVPSTTQQSDVVLLAYAPATSGFNEYRRGGGLRFCLSPRMDGWINETTR